MTCFFDIEKKQQIKYFALGIEKYFRTLNNL